MQLDPEILLRKRRSVIDEWMAFSRADALVDDWRAAEADAELARQLKGG